MQTALGRLELVALSRIPDELSFGQASQRGLDLWHRGGSPDLVDEHRGDVGRRAGQFTDELQEGYGLRDPGGPASVLGVVCEAGGDLPEVPLPPLKQGAFIDVAVAIDSCLVKLTTYDLKPDRQT